jgi:isoamylase
VECALSLPKTAAWSLVLDTTRPALTQGAAPATLPAQSVLMFVSVPAAGQAEGGPK